MPSRGSAAVLAHTARSVQTGGPRVASSSCSVSALGKRSAVDRWARTGSSVANQTLSKLAGSSVAISEPPLGAEHARGLSEGSRAVCEVQHHPHHDRVEPTGLEREQLGARDLCVHAVCLRSLDHRRRGVDRPHAGALALSSACESRPVPQPTSSTRSPRSSPSRTSASKTSHQFSSTGLQLLVAAARPSNPPGGASLTWRRSLASPVRMRAALDERGLPPFAERQLDRVEVPRQHGRREDLACLSQQLRAEVAGGDVREREQRNAGVPGDFGGFDRGRVARARAPVRGPRRRTWPRGSADRPTGRAPRRLLPGVCLPV